MNKNIVISGINIFEGGPLTIYKELLNSIIDYGLFNKNMITIFVHKKDLFINYEKYFNIIEIPKSRKNYIFRLYYEYLFFYMYSKDKEIDIWLSVHDITPNVRAEKRYVYCHNPSPFLKRNRHILRISPTTYFMSVFYRYLYLINIHKNDAVIVQQQWIRDRFIAEFKLSNIIVAKPIPEANKIIDKFKSNKKYTFLFNAYPRVFKNYEIICEACKLINVNIDYEVVFTISGNENKYAKYLYKKYKNISYIKWIGIQSNDNMNKLYSRADCLIFPSKLETWGLPISEFKLFQKAMLLAALPYAYETIGTYKDVSFFNPDNPNELSNLMMQCLNGTIIFDGNSTKYSDYKCIYGWHDLLDKIY